MAISSDALSAVEASKPEMPRRAHPLITVIRWEVRRLGAARATWISTLLVFLVTALLMLAFSQADQRTIASAAGPRSVPIDWGSNFGLLHFLPEIFGMPADLAKGNTLRAAPIPPLASPDLKSDVFTPKPHL